MDEKEFKKMYDYLNKKASRFSDGLSISEIALSKIKKTMSYDLAIKKIDYVFFTQYRNQRNDEYYKPLEFSRLDEINDDGEIIDFDPCNNNRIKTAYGKDISNICNFCGKKYIKTGINQKFCNPKCKWKYKYKNIIK